MREGEKDELVTLVEYWTLARSNGAWMVQSIEQRAEGDHHLDGQIVASPWSDEQRLDDESLTELAVADGLPEGFTTADLAQLDFDGDARAHALDLSLADARFAPRRAGGGRPARGRGLDRGGGRGRRRARADRVARGGGRTALRRATPRARRASWCAARS